MTGTVRGATTTRTNGNAVVEVEHLSKAYGGQTALVDVSFAVHQGEIFGLLGPNGAGKTTTVECLQGLRQPDGGAIRVLGLDPRTQIGRLRPRIGCQLQESALPDRMKVWEALDLFASLSTQRIDWHAVSVQWGLKDKEKSAFAALSGGQKQRLFVALALLNEPELVFLDEMTQGLDPAARHVAWDLIRKVRDRGATVVLVTHYMDEAERLCDRIAVMYQGRIAAMDTPQGLVSRYGGGMRVIFSCGSEVDVGWLRDTPRVKEFLRDGPRVLVTGDGAVLAHVGHALIEHGLAPNDLKLEQPNLEDVFLNITGAGSAASE